MLRHWQKAGGGELRGRAENGLKLKYDYCYRDVFFMFLPHSAEPFLFSMFLIWFGLKIEKSHAAEVSYMAAQ